MIIKNIYIDKFGGINNRKIEFDNLINIIYSENESGKSTTAEFIKIMLYGIGKSPQNIRGNERTKFMPWGETKMGGEITLSVDNNDYTIIRSFGKRKGDDTINVINALTGEREIELCIESPGEILLDIGRDGFEKTLYIKQLSSKIEAGNDDEILKKLINLAQSGDEGVSFQRAVQILDSAAKELNGTRPRGKMLKIQDEINSLQAQKTISANEEKLRQNLIAKLNDLKFEKAQLESYSIDKTLLIKLKEKYSKAIIDEAKSKQVNEEKLRAKEVRVKFLLLHMILSTSILIAFSFINPLYLIPFGVWAIAAIFMYIKARKSAVVNNELILSDDILKEISKLENEIDVKEKNNTKRLVDVAQNIGDLQNQLTNIEVTSQSEINEQINQLQEIYQIYAHNVSDIALTKKCLQEAFDELQKSFGKRLNDETSTILREITGCKYSEVLVDNNYNMHVRIAENNELQDAQYLSNGTYDQIYFALRMGIINMLFDKAPVILDEAFVQYDDNRLKLVMEYIKKAENRQMLLFSCHKREYFHFNSSKAEV